MSVELRVTSKGEGILTLVGTKVIDWVKGKLSLVRYYVHYYFNLFLFYN